MRYDNHEIRFLLRQRLRLPSGRAVLVHRIRGELIECTYADDGTRVDFGAEFLENVVRGKYEFHSAG